MRVEVRSTRGLYFSPREKIWESIEDTGRTADLERKRFVRITKAFTPGVTDRARSGDRTHRLSTGYIRVHTEPLQLGVPFEALW